MRGWGRAPGAPQLWRRLGTALQCSARGGQDPNSAPLCCGVVLLSPRSAPGCARARRGPSTFPGPRGAGWKLEAGRHRPRRAQGCVWGQPGCLWGRRGHAGRVSGSQEEPGVGCGAVRGRRCLSLGSVLWRIPLSPGWVGAALSPSSSNVEVTVAVVLLGGPGRAVPRRAVPLRRLLEAQPCPLPHSRSTEPSWPLSSGLPRDTPWGWACGGLP